MSTEWNILDVAELPVDALPLSAEIERRYLNYALSVITSRALPDVRDGLKPVQRRILYAMYHDLNLQPDGRYKKSATVVGDVLGKFHPHGDTAAYDALVRMAQDFSLRYPLVDGQGNFGSLDGDAAAAYRYTEAKLRAIAMELLSELPAKTTPYRANFDGTLQEPVVLPARLPHLLLNGATGIAVGMATNIPPHHLGELLDAHIALIDNPELEVKDLLRYIKGPDFPTKGEIVASKQELQQIYEQGQGSIKIRAQYTLEEGKRGQQSIIITSVPYGMNKASIVEKIGALVVDKKVPQITDVRDESTDLVRVVLELKKDVDPELVMAYLYKHTGLQHIFGVNLTCLFPTSNDALGVPSKVGLKTILQAFLEFRFQVVTKRLETEAAALQKRLHLLAAFKRIYDALDEVIQMIRKSENKQDASDKIQKKFKLDEEQVDAILELKLYRLARLEILVIEEEAAQKEAAYEKIKRILAAPQEKWNLIKQELQEIKTRYADKRKTKIILPEQERIVREEDLMVHEPATVILTRDGWVKRVRELKDSSTTRVREGDTVCSVVSGATDKTMVFFSNLGGAYSCKTHEIPATAGYGEPIQKLFHLEEGERVIGAISVDAKENAASTQAVVFSKQGMGFRFSLENYREVSTKRGRRFAKLQPEDELLQVVEVHPNLEASEQLLALITEKGRLLILSVSSVKILQAAGKGNALIRLRTGDSVRGGLYGKKDTLVIQCVTTQGKNILIAAKQHKIGRIGSEGEEIVKKDSIQKILSVSTDSSPSSNEIS